MAIESRRSAFKTSNGRLPPEDGSDQRESLAKCFSDDSRHLIFRHRKREMFEIFRKLWSTIYPPRIAPMGLKLGQNVFQMIPDISFFDSRKNKSWFFWSKNFFRWKKWPPLFGELRQTSQDLVDSGSDSNVSWDVCLNSLKSGFLIFPVFQLALRV